jgi:hypothetical protein
MTADNESDGSFSPFNQSACKGPISYDALT